MKFRSVQVIPEWAHSSFQSERNSRSGMIFHSGINELHPEKKPQTVGGGGGGQFDFGA